MKNNHYPTYHQILTINKEGNYEYIRTGATLNNQYYLSLPVILGLYDTSDPTLRKYLKQYGTSTDSFLADSRLFIQEDFLKTQKFHLKPSNKSSYHPYQKQNIVGAKIPYIITTKSLSNSTSSNQLVTNSSSTNKQLILKELKQIDWDLFISIQTSSKTTQDYWDVAMLKFIDLLGAHVENSGVIAAYSTEYNFESVDERILKYKSNHRHIHILLYKNKEIVHLETIKELITMAVNKGKFNPTAYHVSVYDKSLWATNYILKQYNITNSNFSVVVPSKDLFNGHKNVS
jgi:hypothetical protein